jgi:hypothetical protein
VSTVAVDGGARGERGLAPVSFCSSSDCSGNVGRGVLALTRRGKNTEAREKRLVEACGATLFLLLVTLFRFTKARSRSLRRIVFVGCRLAEGPAPVLSMAGIVQPRKDVLGSKNEVDCLCRRRLEFVFRCIAVVPCEWMVGLVVCGEAVLEDALRDDDKGGGWRHDL